MAEISIEQGNYDVALEHFGKALTITRNILPSNHVKMQTLNSGIGLIHLYQGHLDTALEYFTIVSNFLSNEPHLNFGYFGLYSNLAYLYFLQGKYDLAVTLFEKAIANHLERNSSSCHKDLAFVYVNLRSVQSYRSLVDLYRAKKNLKKAFIYTAKNLSIYKQIYGENHTNVGIIYRDIGLLWYDLGDKKQAFQFITRSILTLETSLPYNPGECATSYESMGCLLLNSSNMLLAIEFFTKTINIRKKHLAIRIIRKHLQQELNTT
jgi:tetratricopeptide (TPR) repeat protein